MRLTLAVLLLALGACAGDADEPGGTTLSVYTFAEYLPDEVIQDYEKASGVDVTVTTYETNEELLASLAARPNAYDVIVPSDYAVEILINGHGLRPLDLANINNYNNIGASFLSPYFDPGGLGGRGRAKKDKFSLPYLWGMTGLAYDKTKVADPLTQWSDLWRPDLGGKLVLLDDAREMIGIGLVVNGKQKNTTDAADIDAARDKLMALAPNVASYDANSGEKALIDGSAVAGVLFSGNAALAQRANPNIEWVLPEDGAGIWFDNLAIPAGAAHPRAAEAFIDYLLSAEAGAKVSVGYPFSNPNEAAINWLRDHDKPGYDAYRSSPAMCASIYSFFTLSAFSSLVVIDVIVYSASLVLEFAALIALRYKLPNMKRPVKVPGGWFGVITVTVFPAAVVAFACYSTWEEEGPSAIWMSAAALATGPLLYPILVKFVKKDTPTADVPVELETV